MNLVIGVLCLWIAGALFWVASHGTESATPWGVFAEILGGVSGQDPGAIGAAVGSAAGAAGAAGAQAAGSPSDALGAAGAAGGAAAAGVGP